MTRLTALIALSTALLLGGCGRNGDEDLVAVSVIGPKAVLRDPAGGTPRRGDAALLGAVAQGLVRLDAAGNVEPGLAIRWAISNDGLYYTFRLDRDLADAEKVTTQMRRLVRRYRDGLLGARLDAVREIVAVTPEVIELRLSAPRPELLSLLAGPNFAILIGGKGTGPLLIDGTPGQGIVLRAPPPDPALEEDEAAQALARRRIHLHSERVALAVTRYAGRKAALVTGGTFDDFIFTRVAEIAPREVQVDPANGLFGFRIARSSPVTMAAEMRQALAMALDRPALGVALGVPGWRPALEILPPGLTDLAEPTRPFWAQAFANVRGSDRQAMMRRTATARRIVGMWRARNGIDGPIRVSLAMPTGPGSRLLFAAIRRQWRAIGIDTEQVGPRDAADLRLIDSVAPVDQADWYLGHFSCARGRPCSEEADEALDVAHQTTDPVLRARMVAEAEQRLTAIAPFIPIAQPVRWSLAAPDLAGFRLNAHAVHPLAPLIGNQKAR